MPTGFGNAGRERGQGRRPWRRVIFSDGFLLVLTNDTI